MSVCGFIKSAAFSPIIMMGAFDFCGDRWHDGGIHDPQSSIPCTRSSSTTAIGSVPILQVPTECQTCCQCSDVSNECFITSHVGTRSNFFTAKLIKGTVGNNWRINLIAATNFCTSVTLQTVQPNHRRVFGSGERKLTLPMFWRRVKVTAL